MLLHACLYESEKHNCNEAIKSNIIELINKYFEFFSIVNIFKYQFVNMYKIFQVSCKLQKGAATCYFLIYDEGNVKQINMNGV